MGFLDAVASAGPTNSVKALKVIQLLVSCSLCWLVDDAVLCLCAESVQLSAVLSHARDTYHICDVAISI